MEEEQEELVPPILLPPEWDANPSQGYLQVLNSAIPIHTCTPGESEKHGKCKQFCPRT